MMLKGRRVYIFGSWIIFSLFLSLYICFNSLPVHDEYFPSIHDYINVLLFLFAGVIALSSISYISILFIKNKKVKIILMVILILLFLMIFNYLYRMIFSISILTSLALFSIAVIGLIHFLCSYWLIKKI